MGGNTGKITKRGNPNGNPDNLRPPWKPGESGNPSGRPKKKPLTEIYEELLQDPEFLDDVKRSIRSMVKSGRMVGQLQLKEMTDRVEGKVTQPIDADVAVTISDSLAKARERVR